MGQVIAVVPRVIVSLTGLPIEPGSAVSLSIVFVIVGAVASQPVVGASLVTGIGAIAIGVELSGGPPL